MYSAAAAVPVNASRMIALQRVRGRIEVIRVMEPEVGRVSVTKISEIDELHRDARVDFQENVPRCTSPEICGATVLIAALESVHAT